MLRRAYVTIRPTTAETQPCPSCWQPVLTVRTARYGWFTLPPDTRLPDGPFARVPISAQHACGPYNTSPRARYRRKG